MTDYIDAAILRKLDALAERYRIKPCDFVATLQPDPQTGKTMLRFELIATADAHKEERFNKILRAIGALPETGILTDRPTQIIDALDHALSFAPNQRRDSSAV
jgi:hypothetical protein